MQGGQDDQTGLRFLRVHNDANETIPAFAALRMTGIQADGAHKVAKPNADNLTDFIAFNGPVEIPAPTSSEGTGEGFAFAEFPVVALCKGSDPAPASGDAWGTENGQWKLKKGNTGFKIVGNLLTNSGAHYAEVVRSAAAGVGTPDFVRGNLINFAGTQIPAIRLARLTINDTGLFLISAIARVYYALPGFDFTGGAEGSLNGFWTMTPADRLGVTMGFSEHVLCNIPGKLSSGSAFPMGWATINTAGVDVDYSVYGGVDQRGVSGVVACDYLMACKMRS